MKSETFGLLLSLLVVSKLDAALVKGKVMFLERDANRVVSQTVVRLDAAGHAPRRPASKFTMVLRGGRVEPHVLLVPAGSAVAFRSDDSARHHLVSVSPGNEFDFRASSRGAGRTHVFTAPGIVGIECRVHAEASAFVHVMDTPYYGFTDANGNYAFDVPPGSYTVTAWNERAGTASSTLEVADDGVASGTTLLTIGGRDTAAAR